MREAKTEIIDGTPYKVTMLGALVGRKILLRLARVIEPLVMSGGELTGDTLRKAISDEDLDFICNAFADATTIPLVIETTNAGKLPAPGGVPLSATFDDHFAGKYGAMLKWLAFCVKFNFESFFAEAASMMATRGPEKAKPSEPHPE